MDRIAFNEIYRSSLFMQIGAILCFVLFGMLTRNWYRAGIICSLSVILFFTYGHIYIYLSSQPSLADIFGKANVIAAIWAASWIILTWWTWRILRHPTRLNGFLNLLSIVLVSFPLVQAGYSVIGQKAKVSAIDPNLADLKSTSEMRQRPPDIYYIILDEYGRADILKKVLSYDNSEFINFLKQKGFYLADDSHSNYAYTHFSLASSLNFDYLTDTSARSFGYPTTDLESVLTMLHSSRARADLQRAGYRFITFATGYSFSEIRDSDEYIQPKGYINDFEMEFIQTSLLALGEDSIYGPRSKSLVLNALNSLSNLSKDNPDQPKFVFAHILAAHAPFVFGPNGESVQPWFFNPGSNIEINMEQSYTEAYINQVEYINKRLEADIETILEKSVNKPIIVIQGDHGPQSTLDWYSLDQVCPMERMSILNAYFFPDADYSRLYPSITPVNTFRVIFDQYFQADYELLPDRSYFSTWDNSYQFVDVTNKADNCYINP
jgi:hypothetical protein